MGTDFQVKNQISVAPYSTGNWYCCVGPVDNPIGKIPTMVTSKMTLSNAKPVFFEPFELKKVSVVLPRWSQIQNVRSNKQIAKFKIPESLLHSPFKVEYDKDDCTSVLVQNAAPVPTILFEGMDVAEMEYSENKKIVSQDLSLTQVEAEDPEFADLDIEDLLEPGIPTQKVIDAQEELNFIRNHPRIPDSVKPTILNYLEKTPELFSGSEFSEKHFPSDVYMHDVELAVPLTQLKAKPFPCSGIRLAQLKDTIQDLLDTGILRPGDSEFTSPVFFVTKKPGEGKTASKGRLCFDYRRINEVIKTKQFPLTSSKDFFNESSKFKIFCVVDICNAFLNIPLTERAKQYLAIITPFGTFIPQRTPFGLKTSPAAFCFAISKVIGHLSYVQYYMDDLLIGAANDQQMAEHLIEVMDRLAKFNLKIRLSKTHFFVKEIKVLGVIFSAQGKKVDPAKVKAISQFGPIDTLKKVQTFLGMLAFISSFIPHFSTACYPLYALLKDQKTKKFELTKEAMVAYDALKEFLKKETINYHPDFTKPLYLAVDASQVGCGAFLYQVDSYPKTEQGKAKMLKKLGFEPEQKNTPYVLPGISPGKNTPVVTDFLRDPEDHKKWDKHNTLEQEVTMTEKLKKIQDTVFHVRPICWFSRCFTQGQILRFSTMEKEFLALMIALLNFRDYIEAAPITYVLSDSQPVLWAMKHKETNVKLSRWLLKLFELNINIVLTHIEGPKNAIADYLSRIYCVPDSRSNKDSLSPKSAQHIAPTFMPLQVLTKEDILKGFSDEIVTPCSMPDLCHLNVNNSLFRGIGPFEPKFTCLDQPASVKKILSEPDFCLSPASLQKFLTVSNISEHQRKDPLLSQLIEQLERGAVINKWFLEKNILCRHFKDTNQNSVITIPESLIPYVLALYHFKTHAGSKKMLATIRLKYYWRNMSSDITEFCRGCILCSIFKHSSQGKSEVGQPRIVLKPNSSWQIDICSGLPLSNGCKSYLNMVDLYSGYTIPVALKGETTQDVANAVEQYLIKPFGPPTELSCDNAANLRGPPMLKLLKFYNIKFRQTVPYSPESHSLVEIQNRYCTELIRIFSDQFECPWTSSLTMASLVLNSVPRPQLKGHSPYFVMFQFEPFGNNELYPRDEDNLDVDNYLSKSLNDRNFVRLVREFLLLQRQKQNAALNRKYKSFPKGTLVFIKDMRPKVHKKFKPVYFKIPQKVITEYKCTIYTVDILGRVKKHSKNNVKTAPLRSIRLFKSLPTDIKLILGEEFGPDDFDKIKDSGVVPLYLADIEIDADTERTLRGNLPTDTHLILEETKEGKSSETPPLEIDDESILHELNDSTLLRQITELHSAEKLTEANLSIKDINRLHKSHETDLNCDAEDEDLEEEPFNGAPSPKPTRIDPGGVNTRNILPEGTKRVRTVRFSL